MPQYQVFTLYHVYFGEMIKYFQLAFCKLYQWFKKIDVDDVPQYSALSAYSILITLNLIAVFSYVNIAVQNKIGVFSKIYVLILFLIIMGVLYVYFIKDRRYIQLCKTYNKQLASRSISLVTTSYILFSLLFFVSVFFL